jgi:hypothetical protein
MTVSRFQGCSCLDGQAATEAPAGRRAEELGKELRGGDFPNLRPALYFIFYATKIDGLAASKLVARTHFLFDGTRHLRPRAFGRLSRYMYSASIECPGLSTTTVSILGNDSYSISTVR